jgi:hypothetical protein
MPNVSNMSLGSIPQEYFTDYPSLSQNSYGYLAFTNNHFDVKYVHTKTYGSKL